jgi:hypothetical protein
MKFGSNKGVRKRRPNNEEPHDLYSSPNIIRVIRYWWVKLANHVVHVEGKKNAYRVLVGKPEVKITLGKPNCKWKDILKWVSKD